MTPNDDEVLARLRAALHTVADRTPISGGRLEEVWAVPAAEEPAPDGDHRVRRGCGCGDRGG